VAGEVYETERLVAEYLLFHYGTPEQVLPWAGGPREALGFPARVVERFSAERVSRALELGCAVGRSAFELSRSAAEVVAIDYSRAFITAAQTMQGEGRCEIERLEEGHRRERLTVRLPEEVELAPERITFEQGDARHLRDDLGSFERVLAANLLCRLSEPQRLLDRLPELVAPGGELILTTPCTWLEEFTPPERWPQGSTREWLIEQLAGPFELVAQHDEPFLIRETARKYQWTVALLTKWKRI
jgi:putative 4-mercaptohistidine N1-methyltranferase